MIRLSVAAFFRIERAVVTSFFIVGIVLNVVLTGLALYWLWRQRMPKKGKEKNRKGEGD